MDDDFFTIGLIIGARGIKGDVKIKPLTDHVDRFNDLQSIQLRQSGNISVHNISSVRYMKNLVIIGLEGIETRNDAERLIGSELIVSRDQLITLEENEFFWFDLLGMDVVTTSGNSIGTIVDIIEGSANDVYVVRNNDAEHLIPAVRQCIVSVDIQNKSMIIAPIPGLLSDDNI